MAERTDLLRVALAQINPTVGDIRGNARKISDQIARARDEGAGSRGLPRAGAHRLPARGPPAEDAASSTPPTPRCASWRRTRRASSRWWAIPEQADDVYNAAAVLADGEVVAIYRKMYLPNYGVFDEQRYFQSGSEPALVEVNGIPIGLTHLRGHLGAGPAGHDRGARRRAGDREPVRLALPRRQRPARASACSCSGPCDNLAAVVFCNTVGGQDELVFDGHSLAIDQDGEVIARAPQFEEALTLCTIDPRAISAARLRDTRHRVNVRRQRRASVIAEPPVFTLASVNTDAAGDPEVVSGELAGMLEPDAEIYAALRTGLRDYVEKNGFERVVIALSGGIDSALAALLAADALGPSALPASRCPPRTRARAPVPTPARSRRTSARTSARSGSSRRWAPTTSCCASAFEGREPDVTEENLQARIRGNVVMALSNKFGWLVLTTGNKSEMSVGYATLYGDMAGGFAVLKDVYKGRVYRLVRWRNEQEGRELVPASVLDRPPSAELRHEQRDDESLPPYDVLDADPRGLHRGGPRRRGARAPRPSGRGGGAGDPDGRPRRVQAPPGPARDQDLDEGVRARPAPADHEPLRVVGGSGERRLRALK